MRKLNLAGCDESRTRSYPIDVSHFRVRLTFASGERRISELAMTLDEISAEGGKERKIAESKFVERATGHFACLRGKNNSVSATKLSAYKE